MRKKKLFCMLLSIAMVFTTMDFPASASETRDLPEEISVEQQSTAAQQETTENNETEQKSVRETEEK